MAWTLPTHCRLFPHITQPARRSIHDSVGSGAGCALSREVVMVWILVWLALSIPIAVAFGAMCRT